MVNSSRNDASGSCRSKDRQVWRSTVGLSTPTLPSPASGGGKIQTSRTTKTESEVAGAPGCAGGGKHRIGLRDGAATMFLDEPGLLERAESVAAEVHRRQIRGAELQVGIVGAALAGRTGRPTVQLVVSVVPRGKGVANAKHQPPLLRVTTAGQRRGHVDQPQPDAVIDARLRLTRVGQQEAEGLVDRSRLGGYAGDQVDIDEVSPESRVGIRAGCDQVSYAKHTDRAHCVPIHFDAIERKSSRLAVDLVHHP